MPARGTEQPALTVIEDARGVDVGAQRLGKCMMARHGVLFAAFLINETVARQPWAHVNVLFSRNVGLSLVVILLYTLTSLSNSSLVPNFLAAVGLLRPEQTGVLLFVYGALPMFVMVPVSIFLLRHVDPRGVVILGFSRSPQRTCSERN